MSNNPEHQYQQPSEDEGQAISNQQDEQCEDRAHQCGIPRDH